MLGFNFFGGDESPDTEEDNTSSAEPRERGTRGPSIDVEATGETFNPLDPRYTVEFDPATAQQQMDRELMVNATDGTGPYLGKWPREMFESAYQQPTQATWIGYVSSTRTGLREVPISHNSWFRHAAVFGTTGYGKTTLLKNLMVQWAYAGWGFAFIDPKGDGVGELLQELPGHRLDDVIWIEPAPTNTDRVVGINFLEPGNVDSKAQYEQEVESIIDDLRNIVKNESYWGPKMDGIMTNIARGMIQSEKPYTLIDMYYILLDERYREMFAQEVEDPAVQRYTQTIAEEMDQSDLDPLLRRLQKMVENRVTREIVAHREATVNLKDAVESSKIILVKNDIDAADVKTMVATGVMRRIWAAIKSRTGTPEEERTPFFMVIDEFDDVVSKDADVEKMLSKARSMRMAVTLCCQQPSQLPQSIRKSIFGNCDNLLAFNPNEPDDAKQIMKRFGDQTATDLMNLGRFKIFTRIMVGQSRSEPFITNTFPDYPPLRSEEEAEKAKQKSLERYGRKRLDPVSAVEDVIIGKTNWKQDSDLVTSDNPESPGGQGPPADGSGENKSAAQEGTTASKQSAGESEQTQLGRADPGQDADNDGEVPESVVLESIYAAEVLKHDDDTPHEERWVSYEEVTDQLENRIGDTGYQSISSNILEQTTEAHVEHERQSGEAVYRLKPAGLSVVFEQDTGSAATGGGSDHRYILRRAFEEFTKSGFIVDLPDQAGEALPDGVADLPIDMSAENWRESQQKMERLQEEYPDAAAISDGSDLYIEAETSTIDKPKQTLRNLQKALTDSRKCVFAVKDTLHSDGHITHDAQKAVRILTDPPCVSREDDTGKRKFYNKSGKVEVATDTYGIRAKEDAKQTAWWETEDGGIRLTPRGSRDSDDAFIEFDDLSEVANITKNDVPAYYTYDRSSGLFIVTVNYDDGSEEVTEYKSREDFEQDWTVIRPPFVPEIDLDRIPHSDDWMVVILPDDDTEAPPLHYQFNGFDENDDMDVELHPLRPSEREGFDYETLAPLVDSDDVIPGYSGPVGDDYTRKKNMDADEADTENEADADDESTDTASAEADTSEVDEDVEKSAPDEEQEKEQGDADAESPDEADSSTTTENPEDEPESQPDTDEDNGADEEVDSADAEDLPDTYWALYNAGMMGSHVVEMNQPEFEQDDVAAITMCGKQVQNTEQLRGVESPEEAASLCDRCDRQFQSHKREVEETAGSADVTSDTEPEEDDEKQSKEEIESEWDAEHGSRT